MREVLDINSGFWECSFILTHSTAIQARINILSTAGSGDLAYTSDDYAAWNRVGGFATQATDKFFLHSVW
jgi:hypothetical protein